MDTSSESDGDEVSHVISTSLSDRRSVYKKQLALCLLLGSILFERITFYSLTNSIKTTLTSNMTVAWSSEHSETASSTFFGRIICVHIIYQIDFNFLYRYSIYMYVCICCTL